MLCVLRYALLLGLFGGCDGAAGVFGADADAEEEAHCGEHGEEAGDGAVCAGGGGGEAGEEGDDACREHLEGEG